MSSNQARFRQNTGLSSRADPSVERSVPPEVRNIELLSRPIEIISDDYNLGDWQETPSKIIRHNEDGVPARQVVHVLQGPEIPRRRNARRISDRERRSRVGSPSRSVYQVRGQPPDDRPLMRATTTSSKSPAACARASRGRVSSAAAKLGSLRSDRNLEWAHRRPRQEPLRTLVDRSERQDL